MIQTSNVAPTTSRIGMAKRDIAPSAATVTEDLLNFFCDITPDAVPFDEIDNLYTLISDLDYLDKQQINEDMLKAKKSTSVSRVIARKWYKKNKPRVKKLQSRLKKSKGAQKKKEIMAKSGRTLTKKKKKTYNTANHVNEAINRSIEKGAKKIVDKWFENTPYRVIRSFNIAENLDAVLNERIVHICNNTWILRKRNGKQYKFEVENNDIIKQCIKHEALIEIGDFL